jgi:hypothetical protein
MPKPFKKLLSRFMSARRGILVRLRVFDLEFLEMVAPTLFQGLGEGMKRNEGSISHPTVV